MNEMENLWQQLDNKLDRSLTLNESLLTELNLDKMKRALGAPLRSELLTILGTAIFVIYLAALSVIFMGQLKLSIPGLAASVSAMALIVLATRRVSLMHKLRAADLPVLEMQNALHQLSQYRNRFLWFELGLGFVAVVGMWPLVLYTGFDLDIYAHNKAILLIILLVIGLISIPVVRHYERSYRQGLSQANALLVDIQQLRSKE